MRCVHESQLHDNNCFVTLTYDNDHLPPDGSLKKEDFQKFMKRLRRRYPDQKPRYYMCGEYGDQNDRPHYHMCLFNFNFPDKQKWSAGSQSGFDQYVSEELNEIWGKGYCVIGEVTYESAAYVARYVYKKMLGNTDEEKQKVYQGRLEEYTNMSRRPYIVTGKHIGIGRAHV